MNNSFRNITEIVRALDREKDLLNEMFSKRKSLSFRYDFANQLVDYKEDRIQFLIDYGVIRDNGDFLELEDVYLKFFEDVLNVSEEINVSYINDFINRLNENIEYFLKEDNERRKISYIAEVRRCLKNIELTTIRNVVDLKRNVDNTYKNEPNYKIKVARLKHLDEKRENISKLIGKTEQLVDEEQKLFFLAVPELHNSVFDLKFQLRESAHNLIEINKQIIEYLNLVEMQSQLLKKIKTLKYLKDQLIWKEASDVVSQMQNSNSLIFETHPRYSLKLSISGLQNDVTMMDVLGKVRSRMKTGKSVRRDVAEPISVGYLSVMEERVETVNLQELKNSFVASGDHLFSFVMNYNYRFPRQLTEKVIYFCQIAAQYSDELVITDQYEKSGDYEYPLIYAK